MSERFDLGWLQLREPADTAARPLEAPTALNVRFAASDRLRVLDLGAGSGSNMRYLAPRLTPRQQWTLVDHDGDLLRQLERSGTTLRSASGAAVSFTSRATNLVDIDALHLTGTDLVTASALLDLVSASWIDAMVAACARNDCTALFALSYNGRIRWTPRDPDDDAVRLAVNAHQTGDKGFGPALGPAAAECATSALERHGYRARVWSTPWRLGPESDALQRALLAGWYAAACEQEPAARERFEAWAARRLQCLDAGECALEVGHSDVMGEPPG